MSRVQVVVVTRGQVDYRTVLALQRERDTHAWIPPVEFATGGLSVADVRHQAIASFLKTEHEVLVMMDNDVGPPEGFIEELANEVCDEVPILGLPTLIAQEQANIPFPTVYRWLDAQPGDPDLANPEPFKGGYLVIDEPFGRHGLVECDGVGSAVIAIHRSVLEAIPRPFELVPNEQGITSFSDDLAFCRRARVAGFRIWADYDMMISHFTIVDLLGIANLYASALLREAEQRPKLWTPA